MGVSSFCLRVLAPLFPAILLGEASLEEEGAHTNARVVGTAPQPSVFPRVTQRPLQRTLGLPERIVHLRGGQRDTPEQSLQQQQQNYQIDQQFHPQSDFSFIWLTDIHWDHLYNPAASVQHFCHASQDVPDNLDQLSLGGPLGIQAPQEPVHGVPLFVQGRRLRETPNNLNGDNQQETQDMQDLHSATVADYNASRPPTSTAVPSATTGGGGLLVATHAGETDPYLGRAGCDSPPALGHAALQFAAALATPETHQAPPHGKVPVLPSTAALLLTGDYAAHFSDNQTDVRKEALRQWTEALFAQFPQHCRDDPTGEQTQQTQQGQQGHQDEQCMQLLIVSGNNDMPLDYLIPSARPKWTAFLFALWERALPSDSATKVSFLRGLYYATRLRRAPGVVVLCLNTVLYSANARKRLENLGFTPSAITASEEADPAGQFAWMRQQLDQARENKQQVVIAAHIPPGFNTHLWIGYSAEGLWVPRYIATYRELISEYSDIVIAQAFGHIHFGRIRALIPNLKSGAVGAPTALLGAPAISPIHGNNPAMAALIFKGITADEDQEGDKRVVLADYVQYSLPLYGFVGFAGERGVEPHFSFEFSIHDTFSPFMRGTVTQSDHITRPREMEQRIDGALAVRLGEALRLSPMAYALYDWHAAAGGLRISSRVRSCEVVALTREELRQCLAGAEL